MTSDASPIPNPSCGRQFHETLHAVPEDTGDFRPHWRRIVRVVGGWRSTRDSTTITVKSPTGADASRRLVAFAPGTPQPNTVVRPTNRM